MTAKLGCLSQKGHDVTTQLLALQMRKLKEKGHLSRAPPAAEARAGERTKAS